MARPNGPNIQRARERRQLSRSELARLCGKTYLWVYRLENELKGTKGETFHLLADVLKVPVKSLMRSEDDSDAEKPAEAEPRRAASPTTHPEPNRPVPPPTPRRRNDGSAEAATKVPSLRSAS